MKKIRTVLGEILPESLGVVLPHEHICCYSEYARMMAGEHYFDKQQLIQTAAAYLKQLKAAHGLTTLVDCTAVNIGRDMEILRRVSDAAEMHIICSTGFYYTEEAVLYNTPLERLTEYILLDAQTIGAGVIKCAVEYPAISKFQEKLLRACARAQLQLGIPLVMHTHAASKNALAALPILFDEGVKPEAITVGHLSDSTDPEYVKQIAATGCFVGFDRLYGDLSDAYIQKKVESIDAFCRAGYQDRLLLSHDAAFFNGFESNLQIHERPRFAYCFEHILPRLSEEIAELAMVKNPKRMLLAERA